MITYTMTSSPDQGATLTVVSGAGLQTVTSQHPNYIDIVQEVISDHPDEDLIESLIGQRPTQVIANTLQQLTNHVSYDGTHILYDGKPIHSSIAQNIRQALIDGNQSWQPLAHFLERLTQNPSMVARTELYDWLNAEGLTIAPDGRFVGYKGLCVDGHSVNSGEATVNGTTVHGTIPNHIGNVISMDRSKVNDDRTNSCSYGLHVGSTEYAMNFSHGITATVLVDPADVVSIPQDSGYQKIRCCKYEVIAVQTNMALQHLGHNRTLSDEDLDLHEYDEDSNEQDDFDDEDDD